jgi:tRNA(His) 5'-end guanylyltransferase
MFDPEHIVFDSRLVVVVRNEGMDYLDRSRVPWRVILNPRRYRLVIWPGTVNAIKLGRR